VKFTALASGSTGNLFTLEDASTRIMIECGLPYRAMRQLLPTAPSSYDACLITHSHADHARGAIELQRRGIPVHCSRATAEAVGLSKGWVEAGTTIGTLQVRTYEAQHDVPTLIFLVRSTLDAETLLFATDTYYLRERFDGVTIWACECNFSTALLQPGDPVADRAFTSHMEQQTFLNALAANDLTGCRQIHLLHISQDRGDPEGFVRAAEALTGIPAYAAPPWRARE